MARQFGGRVAGCHAYAAKMHDVRFRQMESGLPEEFRDEDEMKRQRKIHDQLITKGLEIITDSYIDVLEPLCEKYDVELMTGPKAHCSSAIQRLSLPRSSGCTS